MGSTGGPPPAMPTVPPDTVVLTVGDRKVTAAQFNEYTKAVNPQYQEIARGAGRGDFAKELIEIFVLSEEAKKLNLDKKPEVQAQLEFSDSNILAGAEFQNLQASVTVSDADIRAYYDAHKSEYESVTARHILIRVKGAPMPATAGKPELSDDEAKAKAESIRKRIAGGEDFAKIAKEESDDTSSGENGGDLGEFTRGKMVPPFEASAFALKPGDISEPVQSPFGYHVIQVQKHDTKSLDEKKAEILAQLRPDVARKAAADLGEKAKVVLNPAFFTPLAAAPAPAK